MRLQLKDPQDADIVLPAVTVEALPPVSDGKGMKEGRCNSVLLQRDDGVEDIGVRGQSLSIYLWCFLLI